MRHARRDIRAILATCSLALVLGLLAVAAGSPIAGGATSSTVVGATVPSATFIDDAGCPPFTTGITEFGTVMPGSSSVTSLDCSVVFGSSNDTSMLRIAQQDRLGTGMWRLTDGTLDTGAFGSPNGYVTDPYVGFFTNQGHAAARASDGGTFAAGGYNAGGGNVHPAILRLDPDGTVDATFGAAAGVAYADVGVVSTSDVFEAVIELDDGSIVAGGTYEDAAGDERIVIAKFSSSGVLDTAGFGAPNGYVLIDTVDGATAGDGLSTRQLAVDGSGRIVAAGTRNYSGGQRGWIARVTAAGVLDTGGCAAPNGKLDSITLGGSGDSITGLAIAPDGASFYVVGSMGASTGLAVIRYTGACSVDTAGFNAPLGYRMVRANGSWSQGNAIVVDDDGSVAAFGRSYQPAESMALFVGLTSAGALDPAINGGLGFELIDTDDDGWFGATDEYIADAVPTAAGGYLTVGTAWNGVNYITRFWRLTDVGTLDTSWSSDGWTDLANGVAQNAHAMFDAGDGRVVVVGDNAYSGAGPARIARLGGEQVLDYGAGGTWASGANVFGACLVGVAAGATTDAGTWTVDSDGDCADGDADPWRAIPTTTAPAGAKVAEAPSGDFDAEAHLRFGFRAATSQAPGRYVAPIEFEVLAPDA